VAGGVGVNGNAVGNDGLEPVTPTRDVGRRSTTLTGGVRFAEACYREGMTRPDSDRVDTVDERGVTLTAEGRQHARAQLDQAAVRTTPEYWADLRRRIGLPPRAA